METKNFPRSVIPVEKDEFFGTETVRTVKEVRPIRFRAIKIGDTYVVAYWKDGEKNYAVVWPGHVVHGYDNHAEALETLVNILKENAGAKIEIVDVDAVQYVLNVEKRRTRTGDVDVYEESVVEWGDGAYSIDEEVAVEGP